jgi:hypothetical protein
MLKKLFLKLNFLRTTFLAYFIMLGPHIVVIEGRELELPSCDD